MKKVWIIILVALMCLSSMILHYKGFGLDNHNAFMPLAYHLDNVEYYENDWFVQSLKEYNVRGGFIKTFLFFNWFIRDYEVTALVLHFLALFIFSMGFYRVVYLISENEGFSLFSVLFPLMLRGFGLGFALDITQIILPGTIAWAFVIWGVYYYLREKYFMAFLLLGIASVYQIIVGVLLFVVFFVMLLIKCLTEKNGNKKEIM